MKTYGLNVIPVLFLVFFLNACNISDIGQIELTSQKSPLTTMEHIAFTANKCWFINDKDIFHSYRLAPELQSYSGRPRILLVPYENPDQRPLLVVEAQGNPTVVSSYGPLLHSPLGKNIANDLTRWVKGDDRCSKS
ncbi:hypothetical protein [Bartonella tamiae]|uniref:Uncharacterized protein n=1 Tax=Bartonella tamiae Th239 TaxID=1094558 RepID=J0QZU6_9HYPH|nr:hypothetical protein [Bartonella tamiae]EJF88779.1 hypothetical protein ME5_01330 [Bartonella tamiae Th239]EJF94971.1 hypothetical protein MEG_00552 [Bartonella tamiae Th307]